MERIRVVLADDHKVMLDRVAINAGDRCDVVGTATDRRQAVDAVKMLEPDVLILDITMPEMNET